jgi:hypothetical protein
MKRIFLLLLVSAAACDVYESPIPLGTVEEAEFDPALLGTWYTVDPDSSPPDELVVRRNGEREYELQLTFNDFSFTSPSKRTTVRAEGYMVRVNGVPFLNVRVEENDEHAWMFFRYDVLGTDGLQFWSITDDIEVELAASDLRTFVERNLHRTDIYTDAGLFRRPRILSIRQANARRGTLQSGGTDENT